MNKWIIGWSALLLTVASTWGQPSAVDVRTQEKALLTWRDPHPWQAGVVYTRVMRPVKLNEVTCDLKADIVDAAVSVAPFGWLVIYGQVGASRAELDKWMQDGASFGAGGLLGVLLNLWEIDAGETASAWRFTMQLAGQYAYRTADDDGDGKLQWGEAMVMLPLNYHLFFSSPSRNTYSDEFTSLNLYAGPAFSKVDGEWNFGGAHTDFEEDQAFGAVVGVDLWLLNNLSFGARTDWFDEMSFRVSMNYRF
ncbi:MAG: hypothetical protein LBN38_01535 [Verrucomicrobiota bacterium]|jgi:hypothetical protein|nr:hypothetical protein [Verrucomicrobiota bacterium]